MTSALRRALLFASSVVVLVVVDVACRPDAASTAIALPPAEALPAVASPAAPTEVRILDEDGRLSIAMTRIADGVWAMRDVTGRAFGALQAAPEKVVVQDAEGNVVAAVRDGDRGLGVYDGKGELLALLRPAMMPDEAKATRVLAKDGTTLALVDLARVVVDDVPVTTTVQVIGVPVAAVAAGVLTLTQLDITARMALLGWFALRPAA